MAKYNGETDFLRWYKTNTGTDFDESKGFAKPADMDDGTWDVGSTLYKYYVQGKNDSADKAEEIAGIEKYNSDNVAAVNSAYDASKGDLDRKRQTSLEQASTVYDRLKKYLPMTAKAQGLSGLGVSASTGLKAYNTYTGQIGDITKNYTDNLAALDASKNEQLSSLENYKTNRLSALDSSYNALARDRAEKAGNEAGTVWEKYLAAEKEAKDSNYSMVYEVLGTSPSTSADDLTAYVSQYKDKVSPEQYTALLQMAKNVAEYNINEAKINGFDDFTDEVTDEGSDNEETDATSIPVDTPKVTDDEVPTADGLGLTSGGNNFTVEVNGESYSVQLAKGESGAAKYVTDSNVVAAAEGIPENGVFEFGGKIYVKKFGNVYEVEKRTLDNSEQYEALLSALRRKNEPHPNPQVSPDSLTNSSAKESITNNFENIFNSYNQPADMIPQSGGGGYRNRLDQYLHTRE